MRKKIVLACIGSALLLVSAFRYKINWRQSPPASLTRLQVFKNKLMVQCSPDWNLLSGDSLANGISILPGWGDYQWPIKSVNDSARKYFQQGINMYYSFHIIEAMASFKKAARFDPSNGMIFWGQALSYGPNINDFAYSYTPEAFAAAQQALALSAHCSSKEKALIRAMAVRYTADSTVSRASLNQLYADAMLAAYRQFPKDADIAALYVDALMLQHPWEYWKHNGEAQPWTGRILQVLEKSLQQTPAHPGANHYYIHAVEASHNPQRALQSAGRLAELMPSVSHMVHMPSHIYIRSGLYEKGIRVNEKSIKGYSKYLELYPDVVNNAPLYLIHNLHMQTACAMMGSGYDYSSAASEACRKSIDTAYMSIPAPLGCYIQYVYMTPVINQVRFGKWDEILAEPPIAQPYVYANALGHWARGMAYARKGNTSAARQELIALRKNMQHPDMLVVMQPFNAPVDAAKIAEKLLEGTIAGQEQDLASAARLLEEAVKLEDAMIYNEPRDWILPIRPYLGSLLLKAGDFKKSEAVFRDDLKDNPSNHWALRGLFESLQQQQQDKAAEVIKKQLDSINNPNKQEAWPVVY